MLTLDVDVLLEVVCCLSFALLTVRSYVRNLSGGKRAAMAMNGPTHTQLRKYTGNPHDNMISRGISDRLLAVAAPFEWSTVSNAPPHVGQPPDFDYEYEKMAPELMP